MAERFYDETASYGFEPLRFLAFLAVPVALMLLTRFSYRGRVWWGDERRRPLRRSMPSACTNAEKGGI